MLRVGTDIVSIKRISNSIDKFGSSFLDRFLTKKEQKDVKNIDSIAGYWASKEAISKALGCGIGKDLSFLDIEIYKDFRGAPHFTLNQEIKNRFLVKDSSLSISHDYGFAVAVVVLSL